MSAAASASAAPSAEGVVPRNHLNNASVARDDFVSDLTELVGDAVTVELNQLAHTAPAKPELTPAALAARGLQLLRRACPCTRAKAQ